MAVCQGLSLQLLQSQGTKGQKPTGLQSQALQEIKGHPLGGSCKKQVTGENRLQIRVEVSLWEILELWSVAEGEGKDGPC